ncbi:MAG: hydrogenase expression/formation protein HypE [Phycisphaerae bacterium]|nr:hydrogenase expression/formation protein HypE [Phycisphaerae bacterium]
MTEHAANLDIHGATTSDTQERIMLAHGGGGELTDRLIQQHFVTALGNDTLNALGDGALLGRRSGTLVMTTDSFVVQPLEFPGGDIGRLAVCGTVNDLAMMGAQPIGLSLGMIIQEGLPLALLDRVVASIAATAKEAGTCIVTGDTKVIERRGDGEELLINTAGIGEQADGIRLDVKRIEPGDVILINGPIAEHGLAILSKREGLQFASALVSDVAPLNGLTAALLASGADIKFLRDPTRGGVAGVLADISRDAGVSVEIDEAAIPLSRTARHAAEMLGLDPLTIANEGKIVAVVRGADAETVLNACRNHPLGTAAAIVGRVTDAQPPLVELLTTAGGRRVVQKPYGEELPRIC